MKISQSSNIGTSSIIPFPTHASHLSTTTKMPKPIPPKRGSGKIKSEKIMRQEAFAKIIEDPYGKILNFKSTLSTIERLNSRHDTATRKIDALTPRQREIMYRVLSGQLSKNIASDLGISRRTVENHRAAIMKRTDSHSLSALARLAFVAAQSDLNTESASS